MIEVSWSDEALAELDRIIDHIEQFDPRAADQKSQDIVAAGESLRDFPNRGRKASRGRRELVTVWPYIIRYRLVGDRVTITSVRHGAQRSRSFG